MMGELERLQVLVEVVREFKTAILNDIEPNKTGMAVLEIIQAAGDTHLADLVLQAYLKHSNMDEAVSYLDQATDYLYDKIDALL